MASGRLVVPVSMGESHSFQVGRGGLVVVHVDQCREHGTVGD